MKVMKNGIQKQIPSLRQASRARRSRLSKEKTDNMHAESAKLKKWKDSLIDQLCQCLRSGETPLVVLPERNTDFVRSLCLQLQRVFNRCGYQCKFDDDPKSNKSVWTDIGWDTEWVSDESKKPYFEILL